MWWHIAMPTIKFIEYCITGSNQNENFNTENRKGPNKRK